MWNGSIWTPDNANDWGTGKTLRYSNGAGSPDSEGVTFTGLGPSGGIYVSTERDNDVSAISRIAILLYDVSGSGNTLVASREWDLTSDLPPVGANLGAEAITWVPDSFLVSHGFFDAAKGRAYDPSDYPDHRDGLFFVGIEQTGVIYAYALNHADGTFTRVATLVSGLTGVMDLQFDRETGNLWAICDDTCNGAAAVLQVDSATGRFTPSVTLARPGSMPNLNNEGFALAPLAECSGGKRPVYWTDDGATDGHAIRRGALDCTLPALPEVSSGSE